MFIFDLETDGFLEVVSKIHCLVIEDTQTNEVFKFTQANAKSGIDMLVKAQADGHFICGHNVIKYDIPVIKKLYPNVVFNETLVLDTLIATRLIFTNVKESDEKLVNSGVLAPRMRGAHSLEAWGYRLKLLKGEYTGGWETWSQDMEDYCVQDVKVTRRLSAIIEAKKYSPVALKLEHEVAWIVARQERRGFAFNEKAAAELYAKLAGRRAELDVELKSVFGWWYGRDGKQFVPKKTSAKSGYTEGCPITKIKQVFFNPASRDNIASRLTKLYGWKPTELTDSGKPKVDETTLVGLKYPQVDKLIEYLTVDKRIGQVAEGEQAWLKVSKQGVIYGGVITNGAVTGRMTHARPNVAQTPRVTSLYGGECRALFVARKGYVLVGCDAAALELRGLAGYMRRFDNGAYIKTVVEGKKEEGTEVHTVNRIALGLESRDVTKTWFYAWAYGAGDWKLGSVCLDDPAFKTHSRTDDSLVTLGKATRQKFERNLSALGKLVKAVKAKAKTDKQLVGLDGRILHVRAQHSALNTLLQSAGAVQMKKALVLLDKSLQWQGFKEGIDYEFVANIHDEWQIECKPEIAEVVGRTAVGSIGNAGSYFKFPCPLTGEYAIGNNWADTH